MIFTYFASNPFCILNDDIVRASEKVDNHINLFHKGDQLYAFFDSRICVADRNKLLIGCVVAEIGCFPSIGVFLVGFEYY